METIEETRRKNLRTLTDKYNGVTAFSNFVKISPSQISQWLNASPDSKTGKPRSISSNSARTIESKCGVAKGWMDVDHSETADLGVAELTRIYQAMDNRMRKILLEQARTLEKLD